MLRSAILSAVSVVLTASIASAQCGFDAAAKAQSFKSTLVRAYASCPGVTFGAPNSSTMAGVPGCAPPATMSSYRYGEKGDCRIGLKTKLASPCPDGQGQPTCGAAKLRVKCKDVRDSGGVPVESGTWSVRFIWRLTLPDSTVGDVTAIDVPYEYAFNPPNNGRLNLKADPAGCWPPTGLGCLLGSAFWFPQCTNIEYLSIAIFDPDGMLFARLGSSTR